MQQSELRVLQTAPLTNLQVEASQHESVAEPGSQSSPSSTMPLPHDWRLCEWEKISFLSFFFLRRIERASQAGTHEMMGGLPLAPGVARQVVLSEFERVVQMLPMEHGEKLVTFFSETGDL